jgi:hypothetical protein
MDSLGQVCGDHLASFHNGEVKTIFSVTSTCIYLYITKSFP